MRLQAGLDVERLQADVAQVLEHFDWIDRQRNNWHAVPLRSFQGGTSSSHVTHSGQHYRASSEKFCDTQLLEHCPYIAELMKAFDSPIYKARLMKMDAKSTLGAHKDNFPFEKTCRLHIVVKSLPNVTMTIDEKTWHLAEGEMWFTNVRQRHSVCNASDEDRVHVVFDVDWCPKLEQMMLKAVENNENII